MSSPPNQPNAWAQADPHALQNHGLGQPQGYGAEQQISCPSCGAPIQFRGTAVSAVCEYCNSTVVRTGVDVNLLGKVSALVDNGTPVLLHSRGRFDGVPFTVDGRLQVQYERGIWNEWYLSFADGTIGWLADAQGQFAIVRPINPAIVVNLVPPLSAMKAGQVLRIGGKPMVVVDFRGAAYKGAEGLLPFEAAPGMTFYGADLRGYQGEFVTLDYGGDPNHQRPTPYQGRAITLSEVQLFPLRRFEGWPPPQPPSPQPVA